MSCDFDRIKLSAYLDGELTDGPDRQEVEVHLKVCPECAQLLEGFEKSDQAFADYARVDKPAEYWQAYEAKLKEKLVQAGPGPGRFVRRMVVWYGLVPVAAAVLLAVTLYLLIPLPRLIKEDPSGGVPSATTATVIETISPEKTLVSSEAALVTFINMDENNPDELVSFQNGVNEAGLLEKVRYNKVAVRDEELQNHFRKLEAVLVRAQNGASFDEVNALKEVIIENGLLEENKTNRYRLSR